MWLKGGWVKSRMCVNRDSTTLGEIEWCETTRVRVGSWITSIPR